MKKLKLIETITNSDKVLLLENRGGEVGILPSLILDTDVYNDLSNTIGFELYLNCGKRKVSAYFNSLLEIAENQNIDSPIQTVNRLLGINIRNKYKNKWTNTYNALGLEYSVIDNVDYNDTITYTDGESKTYEDSKTGKTDTNDKTVYNVTTDENTSASTDETVSTTRTTDNAVYGYNSEISVPDDSTNVNETVSTVGNADNNTTTSKNLKTGSETDTINTTESSSGNGKSNRTLEHTETKHTSGRNKDATSMVDAEIELRNKHIFVNMVLNDILTEISLQIY